MKINTQETSRVIQSRQIPKQTDSPIGRFDEFLGKAMSPQSTPTPALATVPALQGLSALTFSVPTGVDRSQAVKNIDELLNVIESYQNKMADPKVSLKEIYPVVQQMEKKAAELLPTSVSLPDGDKLKEILNRVLVVSTVETIKFNRGDYI
jgi:hypothetical protein